MDFQNSGSRIDQSRSNKAKNHHEAFSSVNSPDLVRETKEFNNTSYKSKKIINFLDGFITFCLSATFFGIPLFFTGLAYQGISFEKQIYFYFWILLALVAWAIKSVIKGEMLLRKTPLDIPILLLLVSYILATIFSVDRWHSFWGYFGDPSRGLMNIIALVVAYYLIAEHFNRRRVVIFIALLSASSFILMTHILLLSLGIKYIPLKIANYIPLSPIGSLTGAGVFLSAMIPLLIALLFILSERKTGNKFFNVIIKAFLLVSVFGNLFLLFVVYNYVSWLGILIGTSFFLIYILAKIVRPKNSIVWVPMIVFVFVLLILMVGPIFNSKIQFPVEVSPSFAMSWEIAKESVKDSFLFGSGPANYGSAFSLYKPQSFNLNPYYNLRFYQGSGIFFESISSIGIIGTLLLLLVVITYISAGMYLLSIDKSKNKMLSLGLYSTSLIFLVDAFSGKIEGSIFVISVLIAALAMSALHFESEAEDRKLILSLKASPKFALSLAFLFMVISAGVVFLFVFIGKAYIADLSIGFAVRKNNPDAVLQKTAKAILLNNKEDRYFGLYSQLTLEAANNEILKNEKEKNIANVQQYLNEAIYSATKAKEISRNDVYATELLAQVYENSSLYVQDSVKLAEDNYKRAIELEPHNPVFYLKLGQLVLSQASFEKDAENEKSLIAQSKEWFKKSIDEKNDLAQAYLEISISHDLLNETDEAIMNAEKAFSLQEENLNFMFNLAGLYQKRGKNNDYKNAELLYKEILKSNEKEINTHFSLGSLYEKTGKTSEAVDEYRKVLELLPLENNELKEKIEKMISNVQNGIRNSQENVDQNFDQSQNTSGANE